MRRSGIVCLLPVRNGSLDLPGYFESVRRFADSVIALDDGSTDDTVEHLASEPLVTKVIRHPIRTSYRGWNDARNRSELLRAARDVDPEWVVWLDADERLCAEDANALLGLLESSPRKDWVYCFQVFRMVGDAQMFDQRGPFVCRMFAFDRNHRLPGQRLHFTVAPTCIPPINWMRTSIRIQHLGGATRARREARYAKYMECDPHGRYQASYGHILEPDGIPKPWPSRGPAEPWVLGRHGDIYAKDPRW